MSPLTSDNGGGSLIGQQRGRANKSYLKIYDTSIKWKFVEVPRLWDRVEWHFPSLFIIFKSRRAKGRHGGKDKTSTASA